MSVHLLIQKRVLCNEICVCLRARRSLLVIAQPLAAGTKELCREGFG